VSSLGVDSNFYIGNQQQQNFSSTELAKLNTVDGKTTRLAFTGTLTGQVNIEPNLMVTRTDIQKWLSINRPINKSNDKHTKNNRQYRIMAARLDIP
jgi:hypothetical protein